MKLVGIVALGVLTLPLGGCMTAVMAVGTMDAKLQCLSDPDDNPERLRTRGEFPFRLVYDDNGKRKVIEETQICQFKGRSCDMYGRDDVWESKLKSGKAEALIHSANQGDEVQRFVASQGACSVLMADAAYRTKEDNPIYAVSLKRYKNGKLTGGSGALSATHLLKQRGVEIVSFEQWSADAAEAGH